MALTFSGVTIVGGWNILGSDGPAVTPTVEYLVVAGGGGGGNGGVAGSDGGGGGGGGASGPGSVGPAGNGGSGIVILSYPSAYANASVTTGNPNVIVSGGNTIYRFWQSGSITF